MKQATLLAPQPSWLPDVLAALAEHEYLGAHQVAALTAQTIEAVTPVLERLVRDRHARILAAHTGSKAYALALRGAKLLAELSGDEPVPVGRSCGTAMLDHELVRNDLAVVLKLLDSEGAIELLGWKTARSELADAVVLVRPRGSERIALVADALAVVATPTGPTALLVEIDMGTVSLKRMCAKYEGYAAWWRGGGPERQFRIKSLRVLTIVTNQARLVRLRAAAGEVAGSAAHGLFWFATTDVLDVDEPVKLLAPTFSTPSGASDRRLFEARPAAT